MSIDHVQEDRSIDMEGNLTPSSTTVNIVDADLPMRPNVLVCFICTEPPIDPVSTSCGHVFCWPCIYQWLQNRPKPCPVCRYTLRKDLDIIPLYGGGSGAREEPSNGNGRPGEIAASNIFIPPRPRNPLLVMATESTEVTTDIDNCLSVSIVFTPSTVLTAYQRSLSELSLALSVERVRAHNMVIERISLLVEENNLVQENSILGRELEDRHWQIFLVRNQKLQNEGRVNELERRNFLLVREAEASQARERRLIERGNQRREHIIRLQKRLDRANQKLPPESKGL